MFFSVSPIKPGFRRRRRAAPLRLFQFLRNVFLFLFFFFRPEVNTAYLARRWKTKKKLSLLEKQKLVNRRLQEAGMVWNPAVPGLVLKPDHIREAKDFAEAYQDVKAITWEKQALFVDLKLWTPRLSESLVVLF